MFFVGVWEVVELDGELIAKNVRREEFRSQAVAQAFVRVAHRGAGSVYGRGIAGCSRFGEPWEEFEASMIVRLGDVAGMAVKLMSR